MKRSLKIATAFSIASAICAAIGAVFYYISLASAFEGPIGHFDSSPFLIAFISCAVICAVLSAISGIMPCRKASIVEHDRHGLFVVWSFVILGALMLAGAVLDLKDAIGVSMAKITKEQIIAIVTPVLAFIGAIGFILTSGGKATERARSYLSFAAIAWAIFNTLSIYFDANRSINSPLKSIALVVSIVNMLFITEDTRFLIRTQTTTIYRAAATLCVSFGLLFSLPQFVISVLLRAGVTSSMLFDSADGIFRTFGFNALGDVTAIAISVCAFARLISLNKISGEYVAPKHEKKKSKSTDEKSESEVISDKEADPSAEK